MKDIENRNLSLTKGQLSLWTGEKLHPNTALRNMIYTFEIHGGLDISVFKKAFQSSINQIEALRTIFIEKNDTIVQSILPQLQYEIKVYDAPKDSSSLSLENWIYQLNSSPLDLSSTIFKSELIKINSERFIWVLNVHHLVTDTISQKLIFDQTQENYQNYLDGNAIDVTPKPSFKNYITYEKTELVNTKNEATKNFWTDVIKNNEVISNFYGVHNKFQKNNSTRISFELGAYRSSQLRNLAKDPEIRSFTFDLTIFNIFSSLLLAYLFKINGNSKLTIGTTSQNRPDREFKQTVGYFIQIFPLIAEICETDSFYDIIKQTRNKTNANLMHSKSGFVTPEMNRSYNVLFNFINTAFTDFAGLKTTTKWLHNGFIEHSQYFQCHLTDFNSTGNYSVHFDLNDEIFGKEQQHYVAKHFLKVIDAFIDQPAVKLDDISLITQEEIKIIKDWNDTNQSFDENETLLQKFSKKANEFPDSIAIIFDNVAYTYQKLNTRSNQVAHFLIEKGIKKNDIVAVSLERSFDMMVFIYGILKAGAAYLPLDPNCPNERLKFMLNDAFTKLLLYNHNNLEISQLEDFECINITQLNGQILSLDTSEVAVKIAPSDLAYVIYTSGSTGEPKGVMCHHKGICNRLNWMWKDYNLNDKDVFLQKTPTTFDVSVWELFLPMQIGASLVVEIPEDHKDPDQLIKTIKKHKVSVIHFVPSMLAAFVEAEIESCTSLKYLFCSGEVLPKSLVNFSYEKLDGISVVNLYGPTEASVDVTSWNCEKHHTADSIPIGYPVANTKIYIVDKKLQLAPLGVKGELCISGIQVALGYLNREKLTKEKFVSDVFSNLPDQKMYKTGDFASYNEDGSITYLGRIDNQIKIRGKRIELGEIENAIQLHLHIPQVKVLEKNGTLSAFYSESLADHKQFKTKLLRHLPEFMIPTRFIKLEKIPVTANGKVDRAALLEIDTDGFQTDATFVAPNGEFEELIAKIWKEVLRIEQIGAHDNFIVLGGHSLAAIRITARINEEIEIKFPLNKIFELPTIHEYAKYLEETIIALMEQQK